MKVDENEFFRQATLHICGNLDFEFALKDCLVFLREYMPADCFQLTLYDEGLDVLRTIAIATPEEAKRVNIVIPLDVEVRNSIRRRASQNLSILNPFEPSSLPQNVVAYTGIWKEHSGMLMQLEIKGASLGNLLLFARGVNRYTEKHLRLFSILKEPFAIALSNALRYDELNNLKDIMADDIKYLHNRLPRPLDDTIVGENFGLKNVMTMVRDVAPMDSPVLIQGETGVGKEIIGNAIHRLSKRRKGPFIQVNCGAIPETLIDSELFGHERGSFTGAIAQKRGCFERADKGTIFLDEVAELPLRAQVRMLRVLQGKEIIRVGGSRKIGVDIRIIAATHQDLDKMVNHGSFRADLLFRLKVFPINIPALRERKEDLPALVLHFIEKKSKELQIPVPHKLATGAIEKLRAYSWPGNVRELENVVERALILNKDGIIRFDEILWSDKPEEGSLFTKPNEKILHLETVNSMHIRKALEMARGKINGPGGAAEILSINPNTLRHRMKKLGIPFGRKSLYQSSDIGTIG
jgi:transcriptional regulator with GAF, ATPase, and Fis domain